MMKHPSVFIFSDEQQAYRFNEKHPFNHLRLALTYDLLKKSGALSDEQIIAPRMASEDEIALIHDDAFIQAVKAASEGTLAESVADNYGLGTEDTPIFPQMHEAASLLVGGTLTAVDQVMSGAALHAFHPGGGLHHGFKGKASGFCIYNDSSIAIEYMRKKYGARVLYVDTDAHHGDGVQWAFYDDPDVCTLSIHETGRYLFPGTGQVHEKGAGKGYGFSINVPLDAFTEDDSFLEVYEASIREVADFFKPDVILTQNGADAHHLDPLTHLCSSIRTFHTIPKIAHEMAHEYCGGKWIAVGGGGYDIWRVVPRAWASIWLEMTGQTAKRDEPLAKEWRQAWEKQADVGLPTSWDDPVDLIPAIPRKQEITEKNRKTLEKAIFHILNEKKRSS